MDLKLLNHTDTKILTNSSRLGLVRDIIIFHCCSVRLLSAQNQRVAYKLASQEYLGCARDQPMPGPFPAPPIFLSEKPWGRGWGDGGNRTWQCFFKNPFSDYRGFLI